jgi:hypothetical protein
MRKHTLWAGPEDGAEVQVPKNEVDYFIPGPLKMTPGNVILGDKANNSGETWVGRYTLNSATKRFEWMGYE